jgi:hypothetical protein
MTCPTAPLYPWQIPHDDMLRYRHTLPEARVPFQRPQNYSEAELHRVGLVNRHRETAPPHVPEFSIGTWCIDDFDALYQLRRIPLRLIQPREGMKPLTFVQKYMRWYRSGSDFPPLRLLETNKQSLQIADGHHRYQAAKRLGLSHLRAWVGLAWYKPTRSGLYATDFTYTQAVRLAVQMGLPVAESVRTQAGAAGATDPVI